MSSELQKALELKLSNYQSNRVDRLIRSVRECSPLGAALLDRAEQNGCKIVLGDGMKAAGSFVRKENAILLNHQMSDERLMSTLVHEARHLVQDENAPLCVAHCGLNLESLIRVCRTREADAKAFQCAAAHQMMTSNPKVWKEFFKASPKIAFAYIEKYKQTKSVEASLPEAFKAWFDDLEYADKYDRKMLSFMESRVSKGDDGLMEDRFSSKRAIGNICKYGSACYMKGEEGFLETERAMTIREDIFFRCADVSKSAFKNGQCEEEDKSFLKFFVKEAGGVVPGKNKSDKRPGVSEEWSFIMSCFDKRTAGR